MIDPDEFIQDFLEHKYDPVKAREYYLRTRKLKGRGSAKEVAGAKEYETRTTADAQKRLDADLKKVKVKRNPRRRIGEAEQKLIRARSLAARIKDPVLRADTLAKISATEKKAKAVKTRMGPVQKPVLRPKPAPKPKKLNEDEVPMKSKSGAKLVDFNGKDGSATYSDGSVYSASGWTQPKSAAEGRKKAAAAKRLNDAQRTANIKTAKPVLRRRMPER